MFVLLLISCGTSRKRITGVAENTKTGAIVVNEKDSLAYYLEKIAYLPDSFYQMRVFVTGSLLVKESESIKEERKTTTTIVIYFFK